MVYWYDYETATGNKTGKTFYWTGYYLWGRGRRTTYEYNFSASAHLC